MTSRSKRINITGRSIFNGFLSIIGVLALFYGIDGYFNSKIEKRISQQDFIFELSKQLRPTLILDENGSILHDGGAMEVIKSIEILGIDDRSECGFKMGSNTNSVPIFTIVVTPKSHLAYSPNIQALGGNSFSTMSKRGKGNKWVIELGSAGFTYVDRPAIFQLEVIR